MSSFIAIIAYGGIYVIGRRWAKVASFRRLRGCVPLTDFDHVGVLERAGETAWESAALDEIQPRDMVRVAARFELTQLSIALAVLRGEALR